MASIESLEKRTAETEKLAAQLAAQVQQLESAVAASSSPSFEQFRESLLEKLSFLQQQIAVETEARQQLSADKARLEKENAKLKYRVQHLTANLDELLTKQGK